MSSHIRHTVQQSDEWFFCWDKRRTPATQVAETARNLSGSQPPALDKVDEMLAREFFYKANCDDAGQHRCDRSDVPVAQHKS